MFDKIIIVKHIFVSLIYFFLAAVITWWFIEKGAALYSTTGLMTASCGIAGAKWAIQIGAALRWLGAKKWIFIQRIGFTCFAGSCLLLPYCILPSIRSMNNSFLLSLIAAVVTMLVLYYRAVKQTAIPVKWFWGWTVCLATAISLQLLVVFKIV
jgi:hypothetical protein